MEKNKLAYHPLLEEEKHFRGWTKSTIEYVESHKGAIENLIRGIAKGFSSRLQRCDIEDIYVDVLIYLYNSDDYNITKAYERSRHAGVIVSLEGYVHSCIKYVVIRHCTKKLKRESKLVKETITLADGNTSNIFDTIADTDSEKNYTEFEYELDMICKSFESQRYIYGPDIFQIWFVRLLTILNEREDKYKEITSVLGISKHEIMQLRQKADADGAMVSIAKAAGIIGPERAVRILRKYTYSADKIEQVILST